MYYIDTVVKFSYKSKRLIFFADKLLSNYIIKLVNVNKIFYFELIQIFLGKNNNKT